MSAPIDPQELLAAYATGDISDDERRAVDAYLEANPEARQQLLAVEDMIAQVAANEPQPPQPDWERLTADIMAPISETVPTPKPWWQRPRNAAVLAAAMAAAIVVAVLQSNQAPSQRALRDHDRPALVDRSNMKDESLLPDHTWLESDGPQVATLNDDELTDDWLDEVVGGESPVDLEELDLDDLRAIDRALASL